MGSSELKTFSLSASFVEAYNRTGSGVCLHVCLRVCLCSGRWFVELPPIIVWVVVVRVFTFHAPFVCKCNQNAEELFRRDYISEVFFSASHAPDSERSSLRRSSS